MNKAEPFQLEDAFPGNFVPGDGSIDFFARVRTLVDENSRVLDLGAGRAAWFEGDECQTRRKMRLLKGEVAEIVGADIDEAVFQNKTVDKHVVFTLGEPLPFEDASFDLIMADFVLEHVENPETFAAEIMRLLKPGGHFCARTPHKLNYVAIAASLTRNARHASVLKTVQPERDEVDVFPTHYRLNTRSAIRKHFPNAIDRTFLFPTNPSYFFGKRMVYVMLKTLHGIMPDVFSGNLFVFLQKPGV